MRERLCETCKHWDKLRYPKADTGWCQKISNSLESDQAFTDDGGEGCGASLRTRPTFGCELWEDKMFRPELTVFSDADIAHEMVRRGLITMTSE